MLALAAVGCVSFISSTGGSSSGYQQITPEESEMCQSLSEQEVSDVLGGTATYKDRLYDTDVCEYLVMDTDLDYHVTIRVRQDPIDPDLIDYRTQSLRDDITSTERVAVPGLAEIAAIDRPRHELAFIADGVQYELTLDNNDYDDKLPSSEEEIAASKELAEIILRNVN
ncbi:hypothetical protein [Kineosporia babensis]|uniref:DUF3558 domain-containing protein n=1 Tax=Kineosporia babensis TaxID=499548 RepID=A0A9X1NE11_9ACTN|nr:hypothetical protein [Kineosporia babensis]MCD5312335.1 hypothetical protein [Kineosporia babensis]